MFETEQKQECGIMKDRIIFFCRKSAVVLAALGFFGLFYPELCMLDNTCKAVYVTEKGEEKELEVPEGSELYYKLLSAEPEEIKIRSRLWEVISACFEKDKE